MHRLDPPDYWHLHAGAVGSTLITSHVPLLVLLVCDYSTGFNVIARQARDETVPREVVAGGGEALRLRWRAIWWDAQRRNATWIHLPGVTAVLTDAVLAGSTAGPPRVFPLDIVIRPTPPPTGPYGAERRPEVRIPRTHDSSEVVAAWEAMVPRFCTTQGGRFERWPDLAVPKRLRGPLTPWPEELQVPLPGVPVVPLVPGPQAAPPSVRYAEADWEFRRRLGFRDPPPPVDDDEIPF